MFHSSLILHNHQNSQQIYNFQMNNKGMLLIDHKRVINSNFKTTFVIYSNLRIFIPSSEIEVRKLWTDFH